MCHRIAGIALRSALLYDAECGGRKHGCWCVLLWGQYQGRVEANRHGEAGELVQGESLSMIGQIAEERARVGGIEALEVMLNTCMKSVWCDLCRADLHSRV